MRFFSNYFVMTLLVAVDGTCNEAEKEKITGKLFPNFLYKCSLAAQLDTSAIAPCLERPCQISSGCFFFGNLSDACRNCVAEDCNAQLLQCTGLTNPLSAPTGEGDRCI
ncbi:hypothetical protein FOZ63_004827 [Perkinsus olseni]|uniref:Uncharacterized protein n=1 Tax=Perkinsus olseni TaxID=32597 RepID=A0A7J6SNS9_PEROL|nr:hypothetical protein FOZ63_004827 [Perkinsus olseni]